MKFFNVPRIFLSQIPVALGIKRISNFNTSYISSLSHFFAQQASHFSQNSFPVNSELTNGTTFSHFGAIPTYNKNELYDLVSNQIKSAIDNSDYGVLASFPKGSLHPKLMIDGLPALVYVIQNCSDDLENCIKIIDLLASAGISITHTDKNGNNIIHHAVHYSLPLLEYVILLGSSLPNNLYIDKKNAQGETPLFTAIHNQDYEAVKLLLSLGANPHICNHKNIFPIQLAAQINHYLNCKILIEYGADKSQILNCNTSKLSPDLLNLFFDHEDNNGKYYHSPASSSKSYSYVKSHSNGYNSSHKFPSPYTTPRCAYHNSSLKPYGPPVNFVIAPLDKEALEALNIGNEKEFLENISKNNIYHKINGNGDSFLHQVIRSQYCTIDLIEVLLKKGPDLLTLKNNNGDTPLHTAAFEGKKSVYNLLLMKGLDPSLENNYGWKPNQILELKNKNDKVSTWAERVKTFKFDTSLIY